MRHGEAQRIRDDLGLRFRFEIFLDISDMERDKAASPHIDGLQGSSTSSSNDDTVSECWRERAAKLSPKSSEPLNYSDVSGMPAILILVGRCSMGDTLPSNFSSYDLRARYCVPHITTLTVFDQDAQTAAPNIFSARPKLLLLPVAVECMRDSCTALAYHTELTPDDRSSCGPRTR